MAVASCATRLSTDLANNLAAVGLLPEPSPTEGAEGSADVSDAEDGSEPEDDEACYSFDEASDTEATSSAATDPHASCRSISTSPKPLTFADDDGSAHVMRTRQLSIRSLPGREDIDIVQFGSAHEFVDALGPYEHWSIAPLLGPALTALETSVQLKRTVFLGAFSRSRGRLECAPRSSLRAPLIDPCAGSRSLVSTARSSSASRRARIRWPDRT